MARYNATKERILQFVMENIQVDSIEVAAMLDLSPANASMCLGKYYRFGLLHRYRQQGQPRTMIYSLSDKGAERLDWLREQAEKKRKKEG